MNEQQRSAGIDDTGQRRTYWTEQMDKASEFLLRTLDAPMGESLELAIDLTEALPPSLEVDYAFDRVPSGDRPLFYLRSSLVPPLVRVIEEFRRLSLGLRIEYAYRTPQTQAGLCTSDEILGRVIERVRWEANGADVSLAFVYKRLIVLVANVYKFATHVAAAAVDVTVIDLETGSVVDRGGPFLELSERTPMNSPFVSAAARRNRTLIRGVFAEQGFRAYPYEFWHFSSGDVYESVLTQDGRPARFGPVSLEPTSGKVMALPDPLSDIMPRDQMLERISAALASR